MYRVTFYYYSRVLGEEYRNVELHKDVASANLRALALGWTIENVEEAQCTL